LSRAACHRPVATVPMTSTPDWTRVSSWFQKTSRTGREKSSSTSWSSRRASNMVVAVTAVAHHRPVMDAGN